MVDATSDIGSSDEHSIQNDLRWLAAAARLSWRHVGATAENPTVGCILVRQGRVVGRGVTAVGGRPHAERVALDDARADARGSTAYVTLEPCAHHGRTAPCSDALVAAGVARVVIGARDPDPRVDGKGAAILTGAGVCVTGNIGLNTLLDPLEGFLSRVRFGTPFVTLKMALSADGCVGRVGAGQVAISGAISNRQTHLLRARSDAILVGIGTAIADDPMLTCRLPGLEHRSPIRIVFDPELRLPAAAKLVQSAHRIPSWIATSMDAAHPGVRPFLEAGCRLIALPRVERDQSALLLRAMLTQLGHLGISSLMVEGGPRIAGALLRAGLVDRAITVSSPRLIGAEGILAPLELRRLTGFREGRRYRFGEDIWAEHERTRD